MHRIIFKYKNIKHEALAGKFIARRHKWYLVTLRDGVNFVITPVDAKNNEWIQEQIPGEPVHTKEFIQAVGSVLVKAGIF